MKTPLQYIPVTLATLAITALLTVDNQAAALAYENFTSPATGVSIHNSNNNPAPGGWGGSWFASNSSNGYLFTTQTANQFNYTGYNGASTPAASGGNYEQLASGFGGDQTTYIQRNVDTSGGGTFGSAGYVSGGLIGTDNTTLWGSFLYSSDTSGNTGNTTFSFQLVAGPTKFSFNLAQPQFSNLAVFRINFAAGATDTITVFVNPTLAFDPTTAVGVTSAPGDYSFNAFRAQTTYGAGAGSQTQIDDIRFGSTAADVISTVPEPSTYALLGMGGIGAFLIRRKFRPVGV